MCSMAACEKKWDEEAAEWEGKVKAVEGMWQARLAELDGVWGQCLLCRGLRHMLTCMAACMQHRLRQTRNATCLPRAWFRCRHKCSWLHGLQPG